MTPLSSHRVYEVWAQVIQDEELYEAMLEGRHARLEDRGFDAETIAILDQLHAEPGTKWNVENLRFRAARFVGDILLFYMPRTIRLLTRGDDEWRQDLCYEYLAHHRWRAMGHMQLTECERFAEFVRSRVMRRRLTPPHFDAALTFELAAVRLLRSTADVPADAWPVRREVTDLELPRLVPRRAPVQAVVELDADLRPWLESGDSLTGEIAPDPITVLLYVPTSTDRYRIKVISEGVKVVLERCDGERTVDAIARALEDEHDLPATSVRRLIRSLLDEQILCA
ncbi:MAG TPA: hypothetical protein VFT22_34810 [Kofleriaceae bacterium]|nr:hypothetical protein [Kofleriaceae bacterium]